MKNRIKATLAISLTALGLAGLPALASADGGRHQGDLFKSQPRHKDGGRHDGHRNDQHRGHDRHDRYSKHDSHRHGYGHKNGHKYYHGHRHGFGPKYGYYRTPPRYYNDHHSHMSLSGIYVAPPLGLAFVIH